MEKFKLAERMAAWRERMHKRVSLRHSQAARVSAEGIGVGLMVVGGLMAFVALIAQIWFLPYGWTYIYSVLTGIVGVVLLILGAVIYGAE
jgi:hypothetical protein